MLIESLASGIEVFQTSANDHNVNEMDVVLNSQQIQ